MEYQREWKSKKERKQKVNETKKNTEMNTAEKMKDKESLEQLNMNPEVIFQQQES